MATPTVSLRFPADLRAQIEAHAKAEGSAFSEAVFALCARALDGAQVDAPKAKGKGKAAPRVSSEGMASVMDALPLGNIRAPYQKGLGKAAKG